MIYFASYFDRAFHHGDLISISRSVPARFKVNGFLSYLAPSAALLNRWQWKPNAMTKDEYIAVYRQEQGLIFPSHTKPWLDSLDPIRDQTLLCWEKTTTTPAGEVVRPFCHRYLVAQIVQKYRPDCYGGCDIPNTPPQLDLFSGAGKNQGKFPVGID